MWKACYTLGYEGYRHGMVNHTLYFVDPDTNIHTNTIEGVWSLVKCKISTVLSQKKIGKENSIRTYEIFG